MSHANNPDWPRKGEHFFVKTSSEKNKPRREREDQQKRSRRNFLKRNRKAKEDGEV